MSAPDAEKNSNPPAGNSILIIDDERELCSLIADYLEPLGYAVQAEHDGPGGVKRALAGGFQAVILDVMLPGMDGFEVLRQIRHHSDVPILMLTSRGEETDRIVGLEMGADDYLPKTFSSRELLARLRAVTRRLVRAPAPSGAAAQSANDDKQLVIGPLSIDISRHAATLEEKPLKLTALEFDLLASLAAAVGRVRSREQLIESVADRNYDGLDRSIDVHIWSLRKKLGDDPKNPRFIETVRAVGYRLIDPSAEM